MADIDKTDDMVGGPQVNDGNGFFILECTYDATVTNAAINDIVQMLDIPANTWVEKVLIDVETAETAGTVDVGDDGDEDGWHDGIDATATGSTMSQLALAEAAPNTIVGYSNGKHYATADTIDVKAVAALDECKIRLKAFCFRTD